MPTMSILAAAAMGLVLVVLAAVVVGIRLEPSSQELTGQPPSVIAKFARRLLGVHVRRPVPPVIPDQQRGQPSHAAHGPARRQDGHALAQIGNI